MLSSNHSAALAKSKVMTTVDGAVTVHIIILAGIFEWINPLHSWTGTSTLQNQEIKEIFEEQVKNTLR